MAEHLLADHLWDKFYGQESERAFQRYPFPAEGHEFKQFPQSIAR